MIRLQQAGVSTDVIRAMQESPPVPHGVIVEQGPPPPPPVVVEGGYYYGGPHYYRHYCSGAGHPEGTRSHFRRTKIGTVPADSFAALSRRAALPVVGLERRGGQARLVDQVRSGFVPPAEAGLGGRGYFLGLDNDRIAVDGSDGGQELAVAPATSNSLSGLPSRDFRPPPRWANERRILLPSTFIPL